MRTKGRLPSLGAVIVATVLASGCADAAASANDAEMTVYATPTCGCCGGWIDHMRENGFTVNVVYQDDLTEIRRKHQMPRELSSCHMGVADGFAVEGHVPASVVKRLLAERPQVLGIAAPGMPLGSPGMEMPDGTKQPYAVVSWDATGPVGVFEHVR